MEEKIFDPIERKEFFLANLGGQDITPPDPVTRIERYLQDIIDGNASTIPPITPMEYYLAKISGADVAIPDPVTRPEYYLAKIAGMDVEPPDPITRHDYFLQQWVENGASVIKTVTDVLIHIEDAIEKAAIAVVANIEPIQDLHGYDHPWPAGGGANKWDEEWEVGSINGQTGQKVNNNTLIRSKNYCPCLPDESYSGFSGNGDLVVFWYDASKNFIKREYVYSSGPLTVTSPSNASYFLLRMDEYGTTYNHDIALNYPATVTTYSPYSNECPISGLTGLSVYVGHTSDVADATTYSVDWTSPAGTVYHGTVDLVTGQLTVDYANIASYAGETIGEPWLSSMDEYSPGATPTTGAQVVYKLSTQMTYQLTAQEVQMLKDENYVWLSSGDSVSVTYYAEGNANTLQSLNILLGGNYSNPKTADDVSDKEALEIILGGNK